MDELEVQRMKDAVEVEAEAAAIRTKVALLCHESAVKLEGFNADMLDMLALRIALELGDKPKRSELQRIVDTVKLAEGAGSGEVATPPPPEPPHRGYRFNSTEADAKQRRRLAAQHQAESSRTGLYLVPRRPDPMPVDKPHPPCLVAARDGGTPCSRCEWLLDLDTEGARYVDSWTDRDDDAGVR